MIQFILGLLIGAAIGGAIMQSIYEHNINDITKDIVNKCINSLEADIIENNDITQEHIYQNVTIDVIEFKDKSTDIQWYKQSNTTEIDGDKFLDMITDPNDEMYHIDKIN